MATLTVSMLAKWVGIPADTIRYYDRARLLRPVARTPAGYRLYEEDAVDRLRLIKGGQRLGLWLREVAELLAVLIAARVRAATPRRSSAAALARSTPRSPGLSTCVVC
jgi:DNA-binding transcriptional MerR regulator